MSLPVPTSPNVCFYTIWENRTNEICIEMNKKRQQTEVRSHKNLIMAVWANEVQRLLTYYSTSCDQTRRWWHARVSAGQRISLRSDRTVGVRNLRLHLSGSVVPNGPDLNSQSGRSSGGVMQQANSRSIRRRSRMWMNSRSNQLKSGLVWSRTLLTLLSTNGENVCVLVFMRRANISNIYCRQLNNWTFG